MADKGHIETDKRLSRMEKRLKQIYTEAEKGIVAKADEYFKQFDALDKKKWQQVQEGKLSEYEYGKWRRNKIMYSKRWQKERDRIVAELADVRKTALAYINGELPEVYSLNYNYINTNIGGQVKGYSFDLVNPDTVRNLASEDQTFLPYKDVNLRKYQRWCTTKVNSAIMAGIITGDSIPNLAKRLSSVTSMDRSAAVRNARTMVTSAENKARQDGFERATNNGIIIKREWIAAIDNRTRHAHALLDGQLADVDKPFDSELGEIMYPGDPAADPANVYNCRCTLGSKVIGFEKLDGSGKVLISDADSGIIEAEHHKLAENNQSKESKSASISTSSTTHKGTNGKNSNAKVNAVPSGSELFTTEAKVQLLRAEMINNGNNYETAYVFDANGKMKFKVKGTAHQVDFTSQQIRDMKGCVVTHNHPSNESFSSADICMLKKTKASELRASTRFGTYVIGQPQKWHSDISTYDKLAKTYNSYVDDYISRYKDKAAQEGKPLLYYLQNAEEDATKAFAEKYGMKFRLEKYDAK